MRNSALEAFDKTYKTGFPRRLEKTWKMKVVMEHEKLAEKHGICNQSLITNFSPELFQICTFCVTTINKEIKY